jgi:hypothetical protein
MSLAASGRNGEPGGAEPLRDGLPGGLFMP